MGLSMVLTERWGLCRVVAARLLLRLGRTEAADWAWELLLASNSESYEYIKQSVLAKGADVEATTPEGKLAALAVLDQLAEKHSRSQGIRRLALELAEGRSILHALFPMCLIADPLSKYS